MDRELQPALSELRDLLSAQDQAGLREALERLHPSDLADIIEELTTEEATQLLSLLDAENAAEAFDDLESQTQREVLAAMGLPEIAGILDQMADDDIADLVAELGTEQAEQVLGLLTDEDAQDVKQLLTYDEDTAGGIMTTEFVWVKAGYTAAQSIEHIRRLAPQAETINYIYVLDQDERISGVLSLRELIVADPGDRVSGFMETDIVSVHVSEDQEEVARQAMHYDLLAIPVVDDDQRMLGIVTIDDLIDVIDEEAAEDLQGVVGGGTSGDFGEDQAVAPWTRVKQRLPWLILLMFGNFIAANVMQHFESVLASVVAVAFFVPVLLDSAGNVGTQSLAVTIRGMATRAIGPRDLGRVVWRELQTGLLLGLSCGTIIAVAAALWQSNPMLGVVVGLAMSCGLTVAAVMGVVVPMLFDRIGVDAAVASSPLITTAADVTALLIYFTLATVWMARII